MPDLTTEYYWFCTTSRSWSKEVHSTGKKPATYRVSFDSVPPSRGMQYDWSCTCPAFKYGKGKYCKHIESFLILEYEDGGRCGWHQFDDGHDPLEDTPGQGNKCCPRCKGPVTSEAWGV